MMKLSVVLIWVVDQCWVCVNAVSMLSSETPSIDIDKGIYDVKVFRRELPDYLQAKLEDEPEVPYDPRGEAVILGTVEISRSLDNKTFAVDKVTPNYPWLIKAEQTGPKSFAKKVVHKLQNFKERAKNRVQRGLRLMRQSYPRSLSTRTMSEGLPERVLLKSRRDSTGYFRWNMQEITVGPLL